MDILLIVACLYMAYVNVKSLTEVPLAEWDPLQFVMAGLAVLLVAVGALKGRQYYKKRKAAADAPAPETEEAAAAAQTAVAAQTKAAEPPPLEAGMPGKAPDESGLEDWEIETADFHYTLVELPGDKDRKTGA